MKLSKETIAIITNMAAINDTIIFREGHSQGVRDVSGKILMTCNLPEYIPVKFPILETSKFLKSIMLFDEPEIDFGENSLEIKQGMNRLQYAYCEPNFLKDYKEVNSIVKSDEVETFKLEIKDYDKIKQASKIFRSKNFRIIGKDGNIFISTGNANWGETLELKVGNTDKTFDLHLDIDNIKVIDDIEYNVVIYKRSNVRLGDTAYIYVVPTSYDIEYAFVCNRESKFD